MIWLTVLKNSVPVAGALCVLGQNIMLVRMGREGWIVLYIVVDKKQCVKKNLGGYSHHSHTPVASLLARPHLPNIPPAFKTGACELYHRGTRHPFQQLLLQYIHVALKRASGYSYMHWWLQRWKDNSMGRSCLYWGVGGARLFSSEIPVVRVTPDAWTD